MRPVHRFVQGCVGSSVLLLSLSGCAFVSPFADASPGPSELCPSPEVIVNVEQAQLFREAETERATQLIQEIYRLQADLKTAEAALVEAESGLAGTHTRADAISSVAETRIQIERAATRAPWRAEQVGEAREKLAEAEHQVEENRFGAALFLVYRARRVAESILEEANLVQRGGDVRLIKAPRVNLRAGPSTTEAILSVLTFGTPVFPQANEEDWILVQVSGGPAGWIHRRLVGSRFSTESQSPASRRP